MTPMDVTIANRVRVRRVELGMSQTDMGDMLGVSFQQVQKYEKGVNHISSSRLAVIAELLDVPIDYFFADGTKQSREVDSLLNSDTTFGVRLLRAYGKIGDAALRHQFVELMEAVAERMTLTPVATKRPTNGRRSASG